MGLLSKMKKKKQTICFEGPSNVLVWKHPCENFTSETQLVVHESQTAVFFKNGQALDSFESGLYILNEKNLPLLKRIIPFFPDKSTPIHSEVYFINKAVSMGILWGTDTPIEMEDPEYQLPIYVMGHGDFSIRVADGRKLLGKLVGTTSGFTQEEIKKYFQSIMNSHMRSCIIHVLAENRIKASMAESQLVKISQEIQIQLKPVFAEYGLELNHFAVGNIRVEGLEEITDTRVKSKTKQVAAAGDAECGRIGNALEAERKRTQNELEAEREAQNIKLEEHRILALGSARSEVKLKEGRVEAEINREKGITEQELMAYQIEKIRAEHGGVGEEEQFKKCLQNLQTALRMKAISEEEYQRRLDDLLNGN